MLNLFTILSAFIFSATAFAAGTTDNTFKLGKGASDKKIIFDRGAGSANPAVKWDEASSKLQFANDGADFKDFGSGPGGGGGGVNLLADNPGFEDGTTGWTASGGSFTASAVDPLFGLQSGVFNASALSQTLTSTAYAMPVGLQGGNCLIATGYVYASGADGDYFVQAWDGTTVLAEQSLAVSATSATAYLGFECPSSGTVAVRYIAKVADPGDLKVDGPSLSAGLIHLGSNILLAQVSQAVVYGTLRYEGIASCDWAVSSSTFANFPADTDCNNAVVTGRVSAPGTKIPGIVLTDLPPGTYVVRAIGAFYNSNNAGQGQFRLSDGTNNGSHNGVWGDISGVMVPQISGIFTYETTGTRTIQIQARHDTPSNMFVRNTLNNQLTFEVYRYPTQTQTVLGGLDTMSLYWDGTHNNNCQWTTTSGSFVDPSPDATCTLQERKSRGFGSVSSALSGGNPLPGVVVTFPKVGIYQVCARPVIGNNTNGQWTSYQLLDGATQIATTGQYYSQAFVNSYGSMCGTVDVTAANQAKTLKIQFKTSAGSTGYIGQGTDWEKAIEWSILYVSQSFPMPHLTELPLNEAVILKDVQPSGTASGTFTAGSYVTRVLNTVENPSGHTWVSLSSNQFTLAPGTYKIRARAPAVKVDIHKAKIRNITDSVDAIVGNAQQTSTTAGSQSTNDAWVEGVITIATSKTFELQHRCTSTFASNGLGTTATLGENEIFATVEIVKVK